MSEIVIRHVEARDAEPLRLMSAQPEMYHHLLQLPYPSQELWQDWAASAVSAPRS